jgi:hypothetical protein
MEYKEFVIRVFESEPGKWRASIRRANGKFLFAGGSKIAKFVTALEATTPERALQMALAAIDQGAFSRQSLRS